MPERRAEPEPEPEFEPGELLQIIANAAGDVIVTTMQEFALNRLKAPAI